MSAAVVRPFGQAGELSGTQKAAAVLMQLSREAAAAVLGRLDDEEAEAVASEIVRMRRLQPQVAAAVIEEVHELAVGGRTAAVGGRDLAEGLLEASFGAERAAGFMERLASDEAGRRFEFLEGAGAAQTASLLEGELPQTVALVLAHLEPGTASAVMSAMAAEVRADVAQAIAVMGQASPEAVEILADTLRRKALALAAPRGRRAAVGGVQPLVEIINRADLATERDLMAGLQLRDPDLAAELRGKMLGLADLSRFENTDVQKVLRGIEPTTLAVAVKGMDADIAETVRANISERNRELLDEELAGLGQVRAADVEAAQGGIVRSLRAQFAAGAISMREDENARP